MSTASAAAIRRQLAADLGITPIALYHRERRARIAAESRLPAASPSPWSGVRIWPPLKPDHPALGRPSREQETKSCAT